MDLQEELDDLQRQTTQSITLLFTNFLGQVARMTTAEEMQRVGEGKILFYQFATPEQAQQLKEAIKGRLIELGQTSEVESHESMKDLTESDFAVDPTEWLTLKRYCQKYNLDMELVQEWIKRGRIPANNVSAVELSGPEDIICLVKDRSYT